MDTNLSILAVPDFTLLPASGVIRGDSIVAFPPQSVPYSMIYLLFEDACML